MSDKRTQSNTNETESKETRSRGAFPRVSLTKALELPREMYNLGEGEPVRRLFLFDRMGRKPDSGSSRTLVIASNSGYGLTKGGYTADKFELTPRGLSLVQSNDARITRPIAYEALFSNPLFSAFMARFTGKSVPNVEIAVEYLRGTHGLADPDARTAYAVFIENIEDYGLVQELSGRKTIIDREAALASLGATPTLRKPTNTSMEQEPELPAPEQEPVMSNSRRLHMTPTRNQPQFHINLQIQLPGDGTPDTYDAIFKSIAIHLLGHNEDA